MDSHVFGLLSHLHLTDIIVRLYIYTHSLSNSAHFLNGIALKTQQLTEYCRDELSLNINVMISNTVNDVVSFVTIVVYFLKLVSSLWQRDNFLTCLKCRSNNCDVLRRCSLFVCPRTETKKKLNCTKYFTNILWTCRFDSDCHPSDK